VKRRILFICGSINQTTRMHQIAEHLGDHDTFFIPYFADGFAEFLRRLELAEFTILGDKLRQRGLDYLESHRLPLDRRGARGAYDLVVTCAETVASVVA
jgi:hypothetical protein